MKSIVNTTGAVLVCTALLTAAPAFALEFHVSATGNDTVAGTGMKPFRTVERAKMEVRKKVAEGLREPVTVFLHDGTYELPET